MSEALKNQRQVPFWRFNLSGSHDFSKLLNVLLMTVIHLICAGQGENMIKERSILLQEQVSSSPDADTERILLSAEQ